MRHRLNTHRIGYGLLVLSSIFVLVSLGSAEPPARLKESKLAPAKETVLITYHVIPGKEKPLQELLANVWDVYKKEHLVFPQPHVVVRQKDAADKNCFVEIFTWVDAESPDHAPDSVKKLWDQMQACCEKRDGHPGLEGGEVDLLVPESR
jgi:hypothetical protein